MHQSLNSQTVASAKKGYSVGIFASVKQKIQQALTYESGEQEEEQVGQEGD